MIYGIGLDIQSIKQFEDVITRQQDDFLKRVFTSNEIQYCKQFQNSSQYFAARWCVKEAFLKAMGTGIAKGYRLCDIETIKTESGKPEVVLHGKVKDDFEQQELDVLVSISHSDGYAASQVLIYSK